MRGLLYCLSGLGFLVLIATSWRSTDPSSLASGESPGALSPSRAPASNSSASREGIRRLNDCFDTGACGSSQAALGETLAVALAEHFTNFGAEGDLARAAVESPDPLVKAIGLKMLAVLPPSAESLSAIGNGLGRSSDPALAEGTMRELERYLGTDYEADAQRIVESLVGYTDQSPARRAATLARPFINEHSYDEFREILSRLDSGAEAAGILRSALQKYERRRQGD